MLRVLGTALKYSSYNISQVYTAIPVWLFLWTVPRGISPLSQNVHDLEIIGLCNRINSITNGLLNTDDP